MYFVGIGVMLLIFVGQIMLHGRLNWMASPKIEKLLLVIEKEEEALELILKRLEELHVSVLAFEMDRQEEEMTLALTLQAKGGFALEKLISVLGSDKLVKKIKME